MVQKKILIGCEESGILRDKFNEIGHDAWSCDLKFRNHPKHITGDLIPVLSQGWHMMICHPPCTRLAVSGNRHRGDKQGSEIEAFNFFMACVNAPIEQICIENPIGIMSTLYRQPDQIIQPFFFGDNAKKSTCLWLKNLPKLWYRKTDDLFGAATTVKPDMINVGGKMFSKWEYEISKNQAKRQELRSKTFNGIATAMVEQWGM